MSHILLLGAGFSRNWGGLLATEVFNSLISSQEVRDDAYLRELLWNNQNNGGFENALSELQVEFLRDPRRFEAPMQKLQFAIRGVFDRMNQAFFQLHTLEFQQHQERMLGAFLCRFDAIFTLNQDVLLEHHYFQNVGFIGPRRWNGIQLPGMRRIPSVEYVYNQSWGRDSWIPLEPAEFRVLPRHQPFFKLHGSSNWLDTLGGGLLIIGGDKSRAINSHAVLAWSFEKFQEYLSRPNAKLFVIGYGFRDSHMNQAIINAVETTELRFFVIDSHGANVVRRANPSFDGASYAPNALDNAFRKGLIGASERSLSETFGADQVSHTEVMRFFD